MAPGKLGYWIFFGILFAHTLALKQEPQSIDGDEVVDNTEYVEVINRFRRNPRGYSRGQTQSQYLNFGKPENEGKAEAEATESGSRSFVTGINGMGQAQSQFSSGDCSDCSSSSSADYPPDSQYTTDNLGRFIDSAGKPRVSNNLINNPIDSLAGPIYGQRIQTEDSQGRPIYGQNALTDSKGKPIFSPQSLVDSQGRPIYGKPDNQGTPIYSQGKPLQGQGSTDNQTPLYSRTGLDSNGKPHQQDLTDPLGRPLQSDSHGRTITGQQVLIDSQGKPVQMDSQGRPTLGQTLTDQQGRPIQTGGNQGRPIYSQGKPLQGQGSTDNQKHPYSQTGIDSNVKPHQQDLTDPLGRPLQTDSQGIPIAGQQVLIDSQGRLVHVDSQGRPTLGQTPTDQQGRPTQTGGNHGRPIYSQEKPLQGQGTTGNQRPLYSQTGLDSNGKPHQQALTDPIGRPLQTNYQGTSIAGQQVLIDSQGRPVQVNSQGRPTFGQTLTDQQGSPIQTSGNQGRPIYSQGKPIQVQGSIDNQTPLYSQTGLDSNGKPNHQDLTDALGRPLQTDSQGRPTAGQQVLIDSQGRPVQVDSQGRPTFGQTLINQQGRPLQTGGNQGRPTYSQGKLLQVQGSTDNQTPLYTQMGLDSNGKPHHQDLTDVLGRPLQTNSQGRPIEGQQVLIDSQGRPVQVDSQGRPILGQTLIDSQGRPIQTSSHGNLIHDQKVIPVRDQAASVDTSGKNVLTDNRQFNTQTGLDDSSHGRLPQQVLTDQQNKPLQADSYGRPIGGQQVTQDKPIQTDSQGRQIPTDPHGRIIHDYQPKPIGQSGSTENGRQSQYIPGQLPPQNRMYEQNPLPYKYDVNGTEPYNIVDPRSQANKIGSQSTGILSPGDSFESKKTVSLPGCGSCAPTQLVQLVQVLQGTPTGQASIRTTDGTHLIGTMPQDSMGPSQYPFGDKDSQLHISSGQHPGVNPPLQGTGISSYPGSGTVQIGQAKFPSHESQSSPAYDTQTYPGFQKSTGQIGTNIQPQTSQAGPGAFSTYPGQTYLDSGSQLQPGSLLSSQTSGQTSPDSLPQLYPASTSQIPGQTQQGPSSMTYPGSINSGPGTQVHPQTFFGGSHLGSVSGAHIPDSMLPGSSTLHGSTQSPGQFHSGLSTPTYPGPTHQTHSTSGSNIPGQTQIGQTYPSNVGVTTYPGEALTSSIHQPDQGQTTLGAHQFPGAQTAPSRPYSISQGQPGSDLQSYHPSKSAAPTISYPGAQPTSLLEAGTQGHLGSATQGYTGQSYQSSQVPYQGSQSYPGSTIQSLPESQFPGQLQPGTGRHMYPAFTGPTIPGQSYIDSSSQIPGQASPVSQTISGQTYPGSKIQSQSQPGFANQNYPGSSVQSYPSSQFTSHDQAGTAEKVYPGSPSKTIPGQSYPGYQLPIQSGSVSQHPGQSTIPGFPAQPYDDSQYVTQYQTGPATNTYSGQSHPGSFVPGPSFPGNLDTVNQLQSGGTIQGPSGPIYPSSHLPGQSGLISQTYPGQGSQVPGQLQFGSGSQIKTESSVYPGSQALNQIQPESIAQGYPGSTQTYQGQAYPGSQLPVLSPPGQIPHGSISSVGQPGQTSVLYSGETYPISIGGSTPQLSGDAGKYMSSPQIVTAVGNIAKDDAFSQAESSLKDGLASASSWGKKNGGTAKSQVSGSAAIGGTFSASAMTSDNDRSSSAQVQGTSEGAMTQAQGQGGAAQSQAQVQSNAKTGGTTATSQSNGQSHSSQSEVEASDKGGLADAQSSGPGQTSSQAQIGFRPKMESDNKDSETSGGGQASAQSSALSGQSQAQILGKSNLGVSYHGAAQSASGTKEQVDTYREQNKNLFKTIDQFGSYGVTDQTASVAGEGYNTNLLKSKKDEPVNNKVDNDLADNYDDDYGDEEYEYDDQPPIETKSKPAESKLYSPMVDETTQKVDTFTQKSPTQTQQGAVANTLEPFSLVQKQNGRVTKYSVNYSTPLSTTPTPTKGTTENIPPGFRGTVSQEKKVYTKALATPMSPQENSITALNEKPNKKLPVPESFVTVTNSVSGSLDNSKDPPKENTNFQSTYFTKSSTCGYFTFTCNTIYGANGRSRVCRPKNPNKGKC